MLCVNTFEKCKIDFFLMNFETTYLEDMCKLVVLFRCYRVLGRIEHSYHMDLVGISQLRFSVNQQKQNEHIIFLWFDSYILLKFTIQLPGVNGRQLMNGSPVMSRGQLQIGVNPRRLQSAPMPQAPSHGFLQMP